MLGTLHPNADGHEEIGDEVYASLRSALYPSERPRPPEPATALTPEELVEGRDEDDEGAGGNEGNEDWDEEELAAGGVGGAIGLGTLVALGVGRRRRRLAEPYARPRTKGEQPVWLTFVSKRLEEVNLDELDDERRAGHVVRGLLATSQSWVHRRVEQVSFVDDPTHRHASVDFTVPSWVRPIQVRGEPDPAIYAPLALLSKEPLTNFDLRSGSGKSLPLLTKRQIADAGTAALVVTLEDAHIEVTDGLRRDVQRIAWGSPAQALRALQRAEKQIDDELQGSEAYRTFLWLATTFAQGFMVLVKVDEPTSRNIVKLSYDEPVKNRRPWPSAFREWLRGRGPRGPIRRRRTFRRWALGRLGWRPNTAMFAVLDTGGAGSYHVEIETSPDLEVIGAWFAARDEHGRRFEAPAKSVPGRRVHMYLTAPPGSQGLAWGEIRAHRRGLLRGALVLGGIVTAVLTTAAFAAGSLGDTPTTIAPLLLAVPGALAGYLSRPGEHPLASRLLLGTRVLLFAVGLCSFTAAGLVAFHASEAVLVDWLPFLAVMAANLLLLLIISYLFPRLNPSRDRDGG
jgi:hypothetical protein